MNFAELLTEVYTLTNHPEMVSETTLAVKSATLQVHNKEDFYKDIFEVPIVFDTSNYLQSLEYKAIANRYRKLKYLRKFDAVTSTPGILFTPRDADDLFDDYGLEKTDICYIAGEVIQIKSSTLFQYALFACYIYPDINANTYTSWIADEAPYIIVHMAAARVFRMLKDKEAEEDQKQTAIELLTDVTKNNITLTD